MFVDATGAAARSTGDRAEPGFIAGMLTQQVELNSQNLSIGIVTDARFVRETLSLLDNPGAVRADAATWPSRGAETPA